VRTSWTARVQAVERRATELVRVLETSARIELTDGLNMGPLIVQATRDALPPLKQTKRFLPLSFSPNRQHTSSNADDYSRSMIRSICRTCPASLTIFEPRV
jgi:hypothetical protein